jgi:hypothetical protein
LISKKKKLITQDSRALSINREPLLALDTSKATYCSTNNVITLSYVGKVLKVAARGANQATQQIKGLDQLLPMIYTSLLPELKTLRVDSSWLEGSALRTKPPFYNK